MSRNTLEDFISKANSKHNFKYNYDLVVYHHSKTPVQIICPHHGIFEQEPRMHVYGRGCPKCNRTNKLTLDDFIIKARHIHGDTYNYDKVVLVNVATDVIITCTTHGDFVQKPSCHLNGRGCRKCYNDSLANRTLTTDEFIQKAKQKHNETYNYKDVIYIDGKTKVAIICEKHGTFYQSPSMHLTGRGCPLCIHTTSKPETQWLDSLNNPNILRNKTMKLASGRRIKPDGFDPTTNTVYEFLGDYYHGNPIMFDQNEINKTVKKTFGQLYEETMRRLEEITQEYAVVYIWENDWKMAD